VAGWIGNALSVAVLRRDRHRYKQCTTNWLLQTLAIVDTSYLATSVLIQPLKVIYTQMDGGDDHGRYSWFQRFYPYVEPHAWALASITVVAYIALRCLVPEGVLCPADLFQAVFLRCRRWCLAPRGFRESTHTSNHTLGLWHPSHRP